MVQIQSFDNWGDKISKVSLFEIFVFIVRFSASIGVFLSWLPAVLSTRLPGDFHGDPSDRLIVASSLVHKAPLVSKDEKIQSWQYLQVIW